MNDDDPFAMLGLERQFDVDPAAMRMAYLKLTAQLHPDRITDPIEQAEAAEQAARINGAYRILMDDESRADALLRVLGGPSRSQEKTLPDGFLIKMMDIRQDMEDVLANGDEKDQQHLSETVRQQRAKHVHAARDVFDQITRNTSHDLLRAARIELNAWRYVERMIEQLDPDHHAGE